MLTKGEALGTVPSHLTSQGRGLILRATVVCPVRNEGPFLLDWVVWYRMIGFDDLVILTNDCTDHTVALLAAFQAAGWLQQHDYPREPGQSIYRAKMRAAQQIKAVKRANWVLVCDIDEYLVIHRGAGRLMDLLGDAKFLGMAINWRVFGSGGIDAFVDRPVHQQFFSAVGRRKFLNRFVKTLFAHPRWFDALCDHGPEKLDQKKAEAETGAAWGSAPLVWVNPTGKVLTYWQPQDKLRRWVEPGGIDHAAAQMNHYMLRSAQTFGTKRGSKSPSAGKDRYNQGYWDRADAQDDIDTSALRYEPEFSALREAALKLPGVAALHYQCCADHIAQICETNGLRAGDDPRYAGFLRQAEAWRAN